ncbi:LysR substrate-binding domain-containing protein [Xanthobacteraceae bacterium Astr-EGSB]|uniref:LysR substrate-binding domain-containing protein n=1 Tax=Astrobacterium formosum TaxID=3069710 RepID=UPI0027B11E25|nr:LysR substrate-binding domain-containing protein [Xanthobacteraceae bacterium Astr-EGSB]
MTNNVPVAVLRAFEAAGRHQSFTEAAAELRLTPSAVSHAVKRLEQSLSVSLFQREGRLIKLTPDGRALMAHVGRGFEELRCGIELISNRPSGLLRLHCALSFATQWISPRLGGFLAENPGMEIRFDAGPDFTRFKTDEYDVDIVYGLSHPQESMLVFSLGEETITPLCAPRLAETIRSPADLYEHLLVDGHNKGTRWSMWFAANGLKAPTMRGMRFERSWLAIAAAADGIGIILDSTRLAERELASGRLVAPFLNTAANISFNDHSLVIPLVARTRWPVRIFASWMARELNLASVTL